jgi:hypothetical protein
VGGREDQKRPVKLSALPESPHLDKEGRRPRPLENFSVAASLCEARRRSEKNCRSRIAQSATVTARLSARVQYEGRFILVFPSSSLEAIMQV